MTDIAPAMIVQLKSGSLPMTVEKIDGAKADVLWHHEGVVHRDQFDVGLLVEMKLTKGSVVDAIPNTDQDYDP